MVVETNPFPGAPKDCRKGMEANLWFQQVWVKYVGGKRLKSLYVVHGKGLHSFNLRKTPLKPWILVEESGKILSAHCDCTIGLLETCSHVGATLFALDDIRGKIAKKRYQLQICQLTGISRRLCPSKISTRRSKIFLSDEKFAAFGKFCQQQPTKDMPVSSLPSRMKALQLQAGLHSVALRVFNVGRAKNVLRSRCNSPTICWGICMILNTEY